MKSTEKDDTRPLYYAVIFERYPRPLRVLGRAIWAVVKLALLLVSAVACTVSFFVFLVIMCIRSVCGVR